MGRRSRAVPAGLTPSCPPLQTGQPKMPWSTLFPKANAQVGKTLFQKVMAGDTTAAIWWSKTQMRWAETQKHELTGADGAPLEFTKIERVIVKNG